MIIKNILYPWKTNNFYEGEKQLIIAFQLIQRIYSLIVFRTMLTFQKCIVP